VDTADVSRDRYGDEKPASEMLFSYGFLESDRTEAREISLNLDLPEDDPLSLAKKIFCQNDSGVRIVGPQGLDAAHEVTWESALAWIACVNEEDGLRFQVAQTTDGSRELETTWKGQKIESPSHLRELLAADSLWDIIQLRAVVLLLERLETQLAFMQETEEIISNLREDKTVLESMFRPGIFEPISQYRSLESELLEKAVEDLIKQVSDLIQPRSQTVPSSRIDYSLTTKYRGQSCWHLKLWLHTSSRRQSSRTEWKTFPKTRDQTRIRAVQNLDFTHPNTVHMKYFCIRLKPTVNLYRTVSSQ
jgi:hypothetical protein